MTLKRWLERHEQESRSTFRFATVVLVVAVVGTLAYIGLTAMERQSRDRIRERGLTPKDKALRELADRSARLNLELAAAEAELDRYTHRRDLPGLVPEEIRECEEKIAHWRSEVERRQAACDELMLELLRLFDDGSDPAANTKPGGER